MHREETLPISKEPNANPIQTPSGQTKAQSRSELSQAGCRLPKQREGHRWCCQPAASRRTLPALLPRCWRATAALTRLAPPHEAGARSRPAEPAESASRSRPRLSARRRRAYGLATGGAVALAAQSVASTHEQALIEQERDRQTDRQTGRGRQRGQRRARPRGWTRGAVAAAGTSLRWRYQLPPKAQPPTPRAWPAVRARAAAGAPTWRLGAVELARRSSEARRTWAARRRATCRPSPAWRRCSSRRRASCRGTPSSGARTSHLSRSPAAPQPRPHSY